MTCVSDIKLNRVIGCRCLDESGRPERCLLFLFLDATLAGWSPCWTESLQQVCGVKLCHVRNASKAESSLLATLMYWATWGGVVVPGGTG